MLCPKCGKEVQEGAAYCVSCGAVLELEEYEFDCDGAFEDWTEEPAIAWCNGYGLDKSEVIEYLENVVKIQTNQEECRRIMNGLDAEYRAADARIPNQPVAERAGIKFKKGIIGILLGLAICNIWIDSAIAAIISSVVIFAAIFLFFVKPVMVTRSRYAAELADCKRITDECVQIKDNCRNAYPVVQKISNSCSSVLNEYYNTGIIKPKYRNLPACAFILEQLENGLTNCLMLQPGDKGAYNKWEEQIYRNAVIDNLDDIRDTVHSINGKLDLVIRNQHLLYEKVNEVNENVNRVVRELIQIKSLSALTAMNTNQMKHTLRNIECNTGVIADNTVATAWAAKCTAMNTASTLTQELRFKTGLNFDL